MLFRFCGKSLQHNCILLCYFRGRGFEAIKKTIPNVRYFCKDPVDGNQPAQSLLSKFKVFREEDSPVIFDIEEERKRIREMEPTVKKDPHRLEDFNLAHGSRGVYEIDDLIDLVKRDKATNLFVLKVPKEMNYVDYMVIVTCKSKRHIMGLAELVVRMYKKKRYSTDPVPHITSENAEWLALDLGNIVLHLMLGELRTKYDLESLWSVGAKFDKKVNNEEGELLKILQKHNINIDDFDLSDRLG